MKKIIAVVTLSLLYFIGNAQNKKIDSSLTIPIHFVIDSSFTKQNVEKVPMINNGKIGNLIYIVVNSKKEFICFEEIKTCSEYIEFKKQNPNFHISSKTRSFLKCK